jgi:hypothetical protein
MSRKKAFVKLYEEYGAPIIDRVLSVLGDGAAEAEVRTAAKRLSASTGKANAPAEKNASRVRPAARAFDPRIEKRKGETPKIEKMELDLSARRGGEPESLSVFDLEGEPFITSMSDMAAAGDSVLAVDDVALSAPVRRLGGQDYMFDTPNSVWAADLKNAADHLELARALKLETGKDPLFLPWAMGPTAIDFSHMPRELMLRYSEANMPKGAQKRLAADIRGVLPDFKALDDPASVELFREATGKRRAALNRLLDQYRDEGGMGIGAARLAMTDLEQIGLPLTSLRNVGRISSRSELEPSTHPSYRTSIPGEGVGRLRENVGALELLPAIMADAGLSDPFGFPVGVVEGVKSPLRSLQMKPKGGVITDRVLRAMEARRAAGE